MIFYKLWWFYNQQIVLNWFNDTFPTPKSLRVDRNQEINDHWYICKDLMSLHHSYKILLHILWPLHHQQSVIWKKEFHMFNLHLINRALILPLRAVKIELHFFHILLATFSPTIPSLCNLITLWPYAPCKCTHLTNVLLLHASCMCLSWEAYPKDEFVKL